MNRELTNRVTMYKTVAAVIDQHDSVWDKMAPFVTAVQQFEEKITAIDAAAQKQETPVSGAVDDKGAARDALEDVCFLICEALGVLAHTSEDHELEALVDLSRSRMNKLGDEAVSNRATTILARANGMKSELATLQVTQANLDEFEQALQGFQAAKEKPRTAVAGRMAQTESLPSLVRDASNIQRHQLDAMVNLFQRSHADFVAAYRSARVIIDRAGSHASPKTPEKQ
jgi:hypothetical protein